MGQVAVMWNTNEVAQGTVYYSTLPISVVEASGPSGRVSIGGTAMADGDGMTTSHSATIAGLSPGTTYYFVLHSVDAQNNESVSVMQSVVVR